MDFRGLSAAPGRPGWVELLLDGDDAPRVLLKIEERSGRSAVTRVIVADDLVDSSTLRAIPLGKLESYVHSRGLPAGLKTELPADVLNEMAERGVLFPAEFKAIDEALSHYLAESKEAVAESPWKSQVKAREPLSRPDGTNPDTFSQQVATAYNEAVLKTSAPAVALAEEADVPVKTVHRWIREARLRGHLPPARQGRAG